MPDDITPSTTPLASPNNGPTPTSSIVEFMLDARVPPGGWKEEEQRAAELNEKKISELAREAMLWRAINSAQWVAWGIVQAKIEGYCESGDLPNQDPAAAAATSGEPPASPVGSEGTVTEETVAAGSGEEEEGFDYLSYAHERALFFWGDCIQMGLVKLEDLPTELRERVKIVKY